jgi:hypothetical protein
MEFKRRHDDGRAFPVGAGQPTLADFMAVNSQDKGRVLAAVDRTPAKNKPKFREPKADSLRGDTLNSYVEASRTATLDSDLPNTIKEAEIYVAKKSQEYGGRRKFIQSPEYAKAYPHIKAVYDRENGEKHKNVEKVMHESGLKYGDRVEWSFVSPFGSVYVYEGIIQSTKRGPRVKIEKTNDPRNLKSWGWHKGFRKI